MTYPGDTADPKDVALWMSIVASEEYGLPGILPVMTSIVELGEPPWTQPGDVKDALGYLWPNDGCSVGYFQQQADDLGCGYFGWGTREQLIQAPYALKRFCEEATRVGWQHSSESPEALGRWCQAVQRSAYPGRYAERGYPLARQLLESVIPAADNEQGWPQIQAAFDSNGWAYDAVSQKWLRSDRDLSRDKDGWLFNTSDKKPPEVWKWPVATDPPVAGGYEARHPTRYTWRADVEAWARYLVDNYDVFCNTYLDHPEGYGRDYDSIDVWGRGGRDDDIDPAVGDEIFSLLFNDPGKPDIDWIIWKEVIYGTWNGWTGEPFGDGTKFTAHRDHVHCTYLR